jgi:hypothetical protein
MDNTPDLAGIFAGGIIAILLSVLVYAGLIALSIWITYTIIWRAVRRGLREFHYPKQR